MIWFSCSKCQKTLGRPEVVGRGRWYFATAARANVVPWDSTAAAPPEPLPAEVLPPQPAPLRPVPVGEEQIPVARRPGPPPPLPREEEDQRRFAAPAGPQSGPVLQPPGPGRSCTSARSAARAFAPTAWCASRGHILCGPCKNFRLRRTDPAATPVRQGADRGDPGDVRGPGGGVPVAVRHERDRGGAGDPGADDAGVGHRAGGRWRSARRRTTRAWAGGRWRSPAC